MLYKSSHLYLLTILSNIKGLKSINTLYRNKSSMSHNYYKIFPAQLGVEIKGIDLNKDVPQEVISQIKKDVHKYRIMIFRDQGKVSGKRQVQIGRWFGKPESTFYKHPESPDDDIFRVSNDGSEGCRGVGRTGWHIDGSFQEAPFAYALYHMYHVPKKGDTVFVPLREIIAGLSPEKLALWQRLYMASDRRMRIVHPLIYEHPVTSEQTLCFHLGMTESFVVDYDTSEQRQTGDAETSRILEDILSEINRDNKSLQYFHKWQEGDFIISDNLAVGHEATEETQLPRSKVGLRVLHRVTIEGNRSPAKHYAKDEL